jgi:site-specific DNA-cytosine methylase
MTQEEACNVEKYMIAEFSTTNSAYGYNLSKGGDGIDYEISRTLWQRDGFREYAKSKMKEAWKDPIKRKNRSNQAKNMWNNNEYRNKITKSVIEACKSPVQCIETQEVFNTMSDAESKYNINHANICRSIRTGYRCGGYHWQYYNDVSAKA